MNGVDIVQTALRWAVLAASVAGVAGCGTAAKLRSFSSLYAEPTDGPVAQLRILANGMVRAVPGQSCVDWRSPGAGIMIALRKGFTSHNGRDLGMPKTRYFSKPVGLLGALLEAELRASGNKPITISFDSEGYQSGIYRHSCNSSFSFIPKQDSNYQILLVDTGNECLVEVRELRATAKGLHPVLIETQIAKLCHASDFL